MVGISATSFCIGTIPNQQVREARSARIIARPPRDHTCDFIFGLITRACRCEYWVEHAGHDSRGVPSWLADPHYIPSYGDRARA